MGNLAELDLVAAPPNRVKFAAQERCQVQTFAAAVVLTNGLGLGDLKIAAGAAVLSVLKNLSIAWTVRVGAELAPKV